ncbi:RsmB/NOP family class I SAM-dependent RNA methyltransferase [Cognatiyoonia sp. IB215182]|uniref:RsmB/NOP family class I SAM-dependent RNA methyltransferase n=1 Tax=Cognatiyoonia sp. IB215182 TaxID=3097353 RepID=UPI002A109054|nr:RsmB/NOP family class I SAM-dependent RNA methyltransferase [Cognatiyoonia sp. IB215182]MDX8353462.1 RsmB/NOP family class I SAM-dependent RNA methyltransferase [Cognatiyoonia sp. IB215182]
MTPGARVAAAITIIDNIKTGIPAEQALIKWARASRFAGSKDRAAIRDYVFDVLRARRSLGDGDGRAVIMRLLRRDAADLAAYFHGEGHAPPPPTDAERADLALPLALSEPAAHDMPDWLWPLWLESLGADARPAALALQHRAPTFLRVNRRNGTSEAAITELAAADIVAEPHETVRGCLRVTENAPRIKTSAAFQKGLVELQDAASQFAVQEVPFGGRGRILDYCAGGGGKALAFADLHPEADVFAHDVSPARMADLPARASRAKVNITRLSTHDLTGQAPFDLVFCDAPCSGSGTWRRTPDAKWRLTKDRLAALQETQAKVLAKAAPLVAFGGFLVYATCSVLREENEATIAGFLRANPAWEICDQHRLLPGGAGDGFFLCVLVQK